MLKGAALLTILMTFSTLSCFAQAMRLERIGNENLNNISFSDTLNGWIVGSQSLFRTTDGGTTWERNPLSDPHHNFHSLHAVTPDFAWLVWRDNSLSHVSITRNGGQSWQSRLSFAWTGISKIMYTEVRALDSSRAWVCGSASFATSADVNQTADGGQTWSYPLQAYRQPCNSFTSLRLYSDSVAALLFCGRVFFYTSTGGKLWGTDSLPGTFNAIAMTSREHIWLAGDSGKILKSTNAGASWTSQASGSGSKLLSISAVDSANIWIVGTSGTILRTSNAGDNWETISTPVQTNLTAVQFLNASQGWIVGDSGIVVTVRNGTLTGIRSHPILPPLYLLHQNHPNPFNPATEIKYQISEAGHVTLKVFDVLGREVATLVNEIQHAGRRSVRFDAGGLPSGVYLYRIQINDFVETKKMLLVR